MPESDDRVAIITGASGGLGRAIAETMGRAGAKTVLAAPDVDWLDPADVARIAVMMAALPAEANVFDLTVLPVAQPSFIGRG